MEGIKNFQGIGGKISYGPLDLAEPYACRQGQKEIYLVKCLDGGKAEKLTDWMELK